MKLRNAYGFGAIVSLSCILCFGALAFFILSILGFGYGMWIWAPISLVIGLYFISIFIYIFIKINNVFKPFRAKDGEIVEIKLTQINLKGWMFTYNVTFEGFDNDKPIKGLLLATWTNANLYSSQIVKAYKLKDKYLMLK